MLACEQRYVLILLYKLLVEYQVARLCKSLKVGAFIYIKKSSMIEKVQTEHISNTS